MKTVMKHGLPTARVEFLLLATLLGAAGCTGSLFSSKRPAPQVYVLTPAARSSDSANVLDGGAPNAAATGSNRNAPEAGAPKVTASATAPSDGIPLGETASDEADLVLSITSAGPGLSSEHIAALRPGARLDYFDHALWGSSAPRVLEAFLINSLQNQGRFRSVISDDTRVAAPYVIDTDLRDFQAEYTSVDSAPTVRVTIVALLMRVQDRALIRMIPVTATAHADSNRMGSVVAAFQQAATEVAASLSDQLSGALQNEKLSPASHP